LFKRNKPPLNFLPKTGNPKCFFRASGGLGDVLVCAGIVSGISGATLAVPDKHFELLSKSDVSNVVRIKDRQNYDEFEVISNFDGIFASSQNLVDANYYDVAANHIKSKVKVASLNIPYGDVFDFVIHPSSSNPNRNWGKSNYLDLANSLGMAGNRVAFLGTKYEPGFSSGNVVNLSDISEDLVWQSSILKSAKYFVGNDSGFCHIAGILKVKGIVLFFNTKPENVVKYYPTLHALAY